MGILLLLSACGTEAKNFCPKEGCKPDRIKREQCAAPGVGDFHELNIKLAEAIPSQLAVEINGVRRLDECKEAIPGAPYVSVQRTSGNRILVRVDHGGAYSSLPTEVAVKVIKESACVSRAEPEVMFERAAIALSFQSEASSNSACPARQAARVNLQ
ncbi:MAG: hypothetical protein EOP11_12240 [Proteobacteria bacterium]|nr:MAG: hypothetical protein EOP11_12240 [Pseudomonadota bacterium]